MNKTPYGLVLVVAVVSGLAGGIVSRLLPLGVIRASRFEAVDTRGEVRASLDKSGLVFFAKEELMPPVVLDAEEPSLRLSAGNRIEIGTSAHPLRLSDASGKILWQALASLNLPKIAIAPPLSFKVPAPPPMPLQPLIDAPAALEMPSTEAPIAIEKPPQSLAERWAARTRVPHPACAHCFKESCDGCYGIYEEVPGTGFIISRQIPDPAPGRPKGVQFDKRGRPMYYIGDQLIMGQIDEEPLSQDLPIPLIELKRIQARHQGKIFSISGVYGFGIGAKGFIIMLRSEVRDNVSLFPKTLEGVPVEIEIGGSAVLN